MGRAGESQGQHGTLPPREQVGWQEKLFFGNNYADFGDEKSLESIYNKTFAEPSVKAGAGVQSGSSLLISCAISSVLLLLVRM